MDVLDIHPKVRQWSEKVQKQELHLRLYRPQSACEMLKFMTVQTGMVCLEGLFFLKKHGSMAYVCKFASEQTKRLLGLCLLDSETKWKCLVIIHGITFGRKQTQHISTNISYKLSSTVVEGWWFGLVLQTQDLGALYSLSAPWIPLDKKFIIKSNVRPSA